MNAETIVVGAGVGAVQGLVLLIVTRILNSVSDIRKELQELNGSAKRLQEWKVNKEKLDDERHETNERAHEALRTSVESLRDRS